MRSAGVRVPVIASGRRRVDLSRVESRGWSRLIGLIVATVALDGSVAFLVANLTLRTAGRIGGSGLRSSSKRTRVGTASRVLREAPTSPTTASMVHR